jgi:hypothetical protein
MENLISKYLAFKRSVMILSGGFIHCEGFDELVEGGNKTLQIIARYRPWSWCDFDLMAAILGNSRPIVPRKDRGKYHKIHKLYEKKLEELGFLTKTNLIIKIYQFIVGLVRLFKLVLIDKFFTSK